MRTWTALYGAQRLVRALCPACGGTALVDENGTACCHAPVGALDGIRREAEATRARVGAAVRRQVLHEQGHCCLYCGRRFGARVRCHGRTIRLRVEFDHMVPRTFAMDGAERNIAAACHVCNQLKGARCFASLEEARVLLHLAWGAHGYEDSAGARSRDDVSALRRTDGTDAPVAPILHSAVPLAGLAECTSAAAPPYHPPVRRRPSRQERPCEFCGQPLEGGRRDRRYCGSTCRVYALRQRRQAPAT